MCESMDWFVLRTARDREVFTDLQAAGVRCFRPMYELEAWNSRKSVVTRRDMPLFPGVVLVGEPELPPGVTRHRHWYFRDHQTGAALRCPEADLFIQRCLSGEFAVRHARRPTFGVGARVRVVLLQLFGVVVEDRGRDYRVRLEGSGRLVSAGLSALAAV